MTFKNIKWSTNSETEEFREHLATMVTNVNKITQQNIKKD